MKGAYLKGDKELIRKLSRLEKKDGKAVCRKGCRAGTKVISQEARDTAPVKTGVLKAAIKTRAAKGLKRGAVGTNTRIQIMGERAFYGSFQELGWKTVNGRRVKGKHFLKKAAEKAGPQALDTATATMKVEIVKAAMK